MKKKEMTVREAFKFYRNKIEHGESVEKGGFIYETLKTIYDLGGGDWKKGTIRYQERAKAQNEKQSKAAMARFAKVPIDEENEQYLKDNPAYAVYREVERSENPLSLLRPEDSVHKTLQKLLFEGAHQNLPTEAANKRANEILREMIYKSAMQFRSPPETPQVRTQKGRYRLTKEDIRERKEIVRKAKKMKKEHPEWTWKKIAWELNRSERTLRDWRHNPEINKK